MSDDLVIAFLLKNTIEVAAKKQRAFIHIYIKTAKEIVFLESNVKQL